MIEGLRPPEGLGARPATTDDAGPITDLVAACELAADGASEIDRSDIEHAIRRATIDPPAAIVVTEADRIVAWAAVHGQRAEADVHPDRRGRGIGSALLDWAEAVVERAGEPRVRQTKTDNDRAAAALFASRGYEPAHAAWILVRALADEPPSILIPDGISIRAYRSSDALATYRVIDDAFNEWPERESLPFESWSQLVIEHGAFSPERSRLAFDGPEMVGAALAFDYASVGEGWVQQLATAATHRHRGIARALLASVFAAFHADGYRMVGLSTDSRTGALSLYERLGMRIRRSYTSWMKVLG